ncbi:MAG: glycosyltransferase family 2 protein [Candidatus Caldarchaeum sp.]|nr:glycosyltransferase family 2 protein [Candidatus Caldarchaeum sp.]MDW8435773.1 glycosyltransferase [Candidatus Caldarchaeum sp.]
MRTTLVITVITAFATLTLVPFVVASRAAVYAFVISAILVLIYFAYGLVSRGRTPMQSRASRNLVGFLFVAVPLAASLLVFVEEFNIYREWYKPVMISSFTVLFLSNMMFLPLSLAFYRREERQEKNQLFGAPVSIIIPAYNEEKWIGHCIEAVLEADYPSKEIIVVDDGSTDNTYGVASRYVRHGVIVLRKPNGGKASALNYGMLYATGEIIVTVDADSIISRDTLKNLLTPFKDPKVVGVAGNVKVVNPVNWLTKNQALEYITQLNITRRATSYYGVVQVMPGPLAAFRKKEAVALGKYDRVTLTEDFDLTVKLLKTGGVIQAPPGAFAYTEAPSTLSSLYRQRLRWYRGNIQVLLRHSDAFRVSRYGFLTYLVFPLLVVQQLVIPILGVAAIPAAIMIIINGGIGYVLKLLAAFVILQSLISLTALDMENEDVRMVLYAPFAVVGYKHLLDIIAFKSIIDILVLRRRPRWTRAEKKGLQIPTRS